MIVGEIRQEARGILQGLWTSLVPVWFLFYVILMAAGGVIDLIIPVFGTVATLIIGGPMYMGVTRIFLRIYNKESFELAQMFDGFKDFARTFSAYLLMAIYTFLWSLLLIVPGIIAALSYSMTFFIMAENPDISASDAIRQSKQMMMGHKTDLFMLGLSFIGWVLLASLTFGIGFLWLSSYYMTAFAIFYHKIKPLQEGSFAHETPAEAMHGEVI
jgi:uncharacterized membrane protein